MTIIDQSSFSPALPGDNAGNGALVNTELLSDPCVGSSSAMLEDDAGNIVIREFSEKDHIESSLHGMIMVSDAVNPFEISDEVIRLGRINVVDLGEIVWVGDKGQGNQPMHRHITKCGCITEIDTGISAIVGLASEFFPIEISGPFDSDTQSDHSLIRPVQTSYPSSIAHLIEVGEFSNRNWTPFLGEFGDHKANPSFEMLASSSMASMAIQDNRRLPSP